MDHLKSIRVFVADDHPVVRNGVVNMLSKEADICIVGETGDGSEIEALVAIKRPDMLILDINMPGLDPIKTTKQLISKYKNLKIIILSAYDDDAYVKGLLLAGAHGYVLKDEALETLLIAIRTVANNGSWLSQRIAGRVIRRAITPSSSSEIDSLTPREQEVLRVLALGMSNEAIAEKLFITKRTVQNHVSSIYSKLEFSSRTEAVLYALKHDIIHIDEVRNYEIQGLT